eukprot:5299839-Pleurochrysis_carterae.AAC.2
MRLGGESELATRCILGSVTFALKAEPEAFVTQQRLCDTLLCDGSPCRIHACASRPPERAIRGILPNTFLWTMAITARHQRCHARTKSYTGVGRDSSLKNVRTAKGDVHEDCTPTVVNVSAWLDGQST